MKRIIRDSIAIDPLISVQGLKRLLERKINRPEGSMDPRFVAKLVRKVTGEMAVVADREKVEERISYLRERNRMICDELLRMAFPPATLMPQPEMIDRRKALEAISNIEARQIKLEMDLGLFTRHIGQLNIDHRLKPMDETTLVGVVETFKAWSTPPVMRKIEPQRVIDVKSTPITNEPIKQQPAKPEPTKSASIPTVTGAGLVTAE